MSISSKALELLNEWLDEKKAYLQLLITRKADRKKWSESDKPEQAEYYKPLYSQSILEVSELEYEIADVERAVMRLSSESEGEAAKLREENKRLQEQNNHLIGEMERIKDRTQYALEDEDQSHYALSIALTAVRKMALEALSTSETAVQPTPGIKDGREAE